MREGAITSETEMDETGMKPRFHLKGIEVLSGVTKMKLK